MLLTELYVIDDLTNEIKEFKSMQDVKLFVGKQLNIEVNMGILYRNKSRKTRAYRRFYITTNKNFSPRVFTSSKLKKTNKLSSKLNDRGAWFMKKTRFIKK